MKIIKEMSYNLVKIFGIKQNSVSNALDKQLLKVQAM
jgi:hypothetical protein